MELLSIFIKEHFLFKKPEYLNFGGLYYFKFDLIENNIVKISKNVNSEYIDCFYGDGIANISAIVGNNGVGKSSFLRVLNQEGGHPIISIYCDGAEICIRNQSDLKVKTDFEYKEYDSENDLYSLYYSSLIDYNLKDFYSPISQSNLIDDSLNEYYFDNIVRQIFFLHNKSDLIKANYSELPIYEKVEITVNNMSKELFLKNDFYQKTDVGKNMTEQLNMLWSDYAVSSDKMLHNDFDFVTNFEIFILSLLVSDDTFIQTNDNGFDIGFQDVLNKGDFKTKLEVFLKKRISNIDGPVFKKLEKYFNIKLDNVENLINDVKRNKLSQISGGFDFNSIKDNVIQTIIRYSRIFELYDFITSNESKLLNFESRNQLILSVDLESTQDYLKHFFKLYKAVFETIQYITFDFRIFNIRPKKKLSTGEQSLLNFYSSIYNFTLKKENHQRKHKQYLLLLDEPETGYHAVWKKKFINSITSVLPKLFSELKESPRLQIIFTTHDALTLSDIPNYAITYLKRLEDNSIKVYDILDVDRPSKSFGANITDLLADSFFVDDGLIGDFAKGKINETIQWLNYRKLDLEIKELIENNVRSDIKKEVELKIKKLSKLRECINNDDLNYHNKLIRLVDEPVLKTKLMEMYSEVFGEDDKHSEIELKRLADKLGYDLSPKNNKK